MVAAAPCEAIILRYTNYGDADRIVTLLTLERGVCSGIARNARNSRRRFGAALQLFNRVRVLWQPRKRGGLAQLAEVELVESATALTDSLEALALAAYMCELVHVLSPEEQPVPEIYQLLEVVLNLLPEAKSYATLRIVFELRLLELVGLLPHIGHCANCWEALHDEWLLFDVARGGTLCPRCAGDRHGGVIVQAVTLGSLARLLRVEPKKFLAISLSEQTLQQGAKLLHQVLASCVGRRIKSAEFLDGLIRVG
ncbi:MAG: DNA repair protein RecO [Desulfobacteraceae bacterium 4572_35.1]|nr:MAG: DNA repair protein RecO [Desulfobacteraceae bacterium 4572_35.1]